LPFLLVIPAQAGIQPLLLPVIPATARAGARANIRAANGPKGERQNGASQAGIQCLCFSLVIPAEAGIQLLLWLLILL